MEAEEELETIGVFRQEIIKGGPETSHNSREEKPTGERDEELRDEAIVGEEFRGIKRYSLM